MNQGTKKIIEQLNALEWQRDERGIFAESQLIGNPEAAAAVLIVNLGATCVVNDMKSGACEVRFREHQLPHLKELGLSIPGLPAGHTRSSNAARLDI